MSPGKAALVLVLALEVSSESELIALLGFIGSPK
jgi:hypothetical protein